MRWITLLAVIFIFFSCSNSNKTSFDVFEGTWKVEGKNQYETWTKNSDDEIVGFSYSLEQNKKNIWEELSIKRIGEEWFYEARVKAQNEGQSISFKFDKENTKAYAFENPEHDFPKQIIYKLVSPETMEVFVLGDTLNSFSYHQNKQ